MCFDMGGCHGSQALEHSGVVLTINKPFEMVSACCGAIVRYTGGEDGFFCDCCGHDKPQMITRTAYQAQLLRDNNS